MGQEEKEKRKSLDCNEIPLLSRCFSARVLEYRSFNEAMELFGCPFPRLQSSSCTCGSFRFVSFRCDSSVRNQPLMRQATTISIPADRYDNGKDNNPP